MRPYLSWLSVLGCGLALSTACTHKAAPGQSVDEVCSMGRRNETVVASGYFQAPILVGCERKDCSFQLTKTRKERYGLTIRIPLGAGPGTMTPLSPPKEKSVTGFQVERVNPEVRDASGSRVTAGDVVKVEGKLEAYESEGKVHCTVNVTRFDAL